MIWLFVGYASTVYLSFAAVGAIELPHHPNPSAGASVYFVFLPGMAIACGGEMFVLGGEEDRQRVKRAIVDGLIRRSTVCLAGAIAAASAIAVSGAAYWTKAFFTDSLIVMLIAFGGAFLIAPAIACAWLLTLANKAHDQPQGFAVVEPSNHSSELGKSSDRSGET